jgi:hypothetical protein
MNFSLFCADSDFGRMAVEEKFARTYRACKSYLAEMRQCCTAATEAESELRARQALTAEFGVDCAAPAHRRLSRSQASPRRERHERRKNLPP